MEQQALSATEMRVIIFVIGLIVLAPGSISSVGPESRARASERCSAARRAMSRADPGAQRSEFDESAEYADAWRASSSTCSDQTRPEWTTLRQCHARMPDPGDLPSHPSGLDPVAPSSTLSRCCERRDGTTISGSDLVAGGREGGLSSVIAASFTGW
ncbi:hypothetical protein [Dokdonella sp.]|uniref:hypothetical protein n=1 Tax=Dokdonella sp. TaxID=2291710 RepID=UPI003529D23B